MTNSLPATEAEVTMEQRLGRLLSAANAIVERLSPEKMAIDIDSELYDAHGLPK